MRTPHAAPHLPVAQIYLSLLLIQQKCRSLLNTLDGHAATPDLADGGGDAAATAGDYRYKSSRDTPPSPAPAAAALAALHTAADLQAWFEPAPTPAAAPTPAPLAPACAATPSPAAPIGLLPLARAGRVGSSGSSGGSAGSSDPCQAASAQQHLFTSLPAPPASAPAPPPTRDHRAPRTAAEDGYRARAFQILAAAAARQHSLPIWQQASPGLSHKVLTSDAVVTPPAAAAVRPAGGGAAADNAGQQSEVTAGWGTFAGGADGRAFAPPTVAPYCYHTGGSGIDPLIEHYQPQPQQQQQQQLHLQYESHHPLDAAASFERLLLWQRQQQQALQLQQQREQAMLLQMLMEQQQQQQQQQQIAPCFHPCSFTMM